MAYFMLMCYGHSMLSSSLTLPTTNTTLDISNETAQLDVQNCIFFDCNIPVPRCNDEYGGEGKGVTDSSRTKDPHSPITILQRLNYSGRRCMWKCHVHCEMARAHCVWLSWGAPCVRQRTGLILCCSDSFLFCAGRHSMQLQFHCYVPAPTERGH